MSISNALKLPALVLGTGIVFGMGLNIGQHLVPAPASHIFLCVKGADAGDSCAPLDDDLTSPTEESTIDSTASLSKV